MTLTKDQLEKEWVPKFTDPNKPDKEKITILKFYSNFNPTSKGYDVSVRAYNMDDTELGNEIVLSEGIACGTTLPPLFIGRSNDIKLDDLKILKSNGTLVDHFSKIILTPKEYQVGGYKFLQYNVDVIVGDQRSAAPPALPCPPCINCMPPCPQNCEPICTKEDSIKIGLSSNKLDNSLNTN